MSVSSAAPGSLDLPPFPFPALAALAARAPLGNGREVALAAFVVARLAHGCLGPAPLPVATREQRAAAARLWLASLTLPSALRVPVARAIDASITGPVAAAGGLRSVAAAGGAWLDRAAADELTTLTQRLLATGD
jgi:hypothetical protein